MAYILLVNAQNSLFFEITVCCVKSKNGNLHYSFNVQNWYAFSVKYTNVPFKIQVFRFIYTKFVKMYAFSVKYQNNGKTVFKIRCFLYSAPPLPFCEGFDPHTPHWGIAHPAFFRIGLTPYSKLVLGYYWLEFLNSVSVSETLLYTV